MLLQRTLFCGPRPWVNEDLYAKNETGLAIRTRHSISLQAGGSVTTNTYFGRFAASYWQRWTRVLSVNIRGTITADPDTHTTILVRASDIACHERTLSEYVAEGSGNFSLSAPLTSFLDGGALWLEVVAQDGESTVSNVEWRAAAVARHDANQNLDRRRFAIAICTYNRPGDCAATVEALSDDDRVRKLIDELYVTDQGDQLVKDEKRYQEAATKLDGVLHYIQQPNLGGSGGFTRGIYEATSRDKGNSPVDILLMDDDVRVEPETVLRMRSFASLTRQPSIVGAQMMFLFNPDYLLASAEGVDLNTLKRGVPTDKHVVTDTSMVEGNLPERRVDAEYNGWWSCLIPSEVVDHIGLPIPFFFQWDDVEYSLRGRRMGIPTITLPGAAVWHADFYWKDVDGFGHFFAMRNGLITAALNPEFDHKALAESTLMDIRHEILGMQYGLAYTHMAAVKAFLEGPRTLYDGGQKAVQEINKGRAAYPETRPIGIESVPSVARVSRTAPRPSKDKLVTWKRLVTTMLGRRIPGPTILAFEDAPWYNTSLYEDVYVTDASQEMIRHRRFNKELDKQQRKELKKLMCRFQKEAPRIADDYRNSFLAFTSRQNWERLYNIVD